MSIFENFEKKLQAEPKSIVFTEGTDARILSAASRLLAGKTLKVILLGEVEAVKKAAADGSFDITGAEIIDPANYEGFEEMVAKFDSFVRRMDAICHRHGEKTMSEWMDNQDVCRMLNISPRTLQTLRDNGTLAYSQINHKTYYRPEDVQRIVSVVEDRRKEAKFKGRTI